MRQESSGKTDSYWDNLWGEPKDYQNSGIADSKARNGYIYIHFKLMEIIIIISKCLCFSLIGAVLFQVN